MFIEDYIKIFINNTYNFMAQFVYVKYILVIILCICTNMLSYIFVNSSFIIHYICDIIIHNLIPLVIIYKHIYNITNTNLLYQYIFVYIVKLLLYIVSLLKYVPYINNLVEHIYILLTGFTILCFIYNFHELIIKTIIPKIIMYL